MFKKILVPLDGSGLGECALQELKNVAGEGSVVILLRAMEMVSSLALESELDSESANNRLVDVERKNEKNARRKLDNVAANLKKKGLEAVIHIAWGHPADIIVDFASKKKVDLIVISTHGRGGISRWAFGSVTDKVLRSATVPVLVVTPKGCHL